MSSKGSGGGRRMGQGGEGGDWGISSLASVQGNGTSPTVSVVVRIQVINQRNRFSAASVLALVCSVRGFGIKQELLVDS